MNGSSTPVLSPPRAGRADLNCKLIRLVIKRLGWDRADDLAFFVRYFSRQTPVLVLSTDYKRCRCIHLDFRFLSSKRLVSILAMSHAPTNEYLIECDHSNVFIIYNDIYSIARFYMSYILKTLRFTITDRWIIHPAVIMKKTLII